MYFRGRSWLLYHLVKWYYHDQTTYDEELDPISNQTHYKHFPGLQRYLVDLSHICHNGFCLNPLHLEFEVHSRNIHRNGCIDGENCSHTHGGPACALNTSADFKPVSKRSGPDPKKQKKQARSVILKYKGFVKKLY